MNFEDESARRQTEVRGLDDEERSQALLDSERCDPVLKDALANFRLSVHAWSEAVYNRPHSPMATAPRRRGWRLAAAWALGCVLVAGSVSGGVYEQHRKEVRIAAQREAEHQRQLAAERERQQALKQVQEQAREEEELLAKVDSDIARQVPSAMEPLAQLMAEDETR